MNTKLFKNITIFATFTLGLCSVVTAQKEGDVKPGDETGGGGSEGIDCNGLGTAITNGTFYKRTEANPPLSGANFVDPGLSINNSVTPANTGVLAGSSMRVQVNSSGNIINQFTGVSTQASCVNASLSVPNSGGSGRLFWDTGSGMTPPSPTGTGGTYTLTAANNTDGHSLFGCFQASGQSGGQNYYDYTYTLDFTTPTQVDAVYWETYVIHGGTKQVFVNGVLVTNSLNSSSGTDTDSNGNNNSSNLRYNSIAVNQMLSGTNNTITLRISGADPALGDFAILGCCPTKVPEPSSAMLLIGTCAIGLMRRKRH